MSSFLSNPFFVLMRGMVDDKDGRTGGGCAFWGSVFLPLYVFFKRSFTCSLAGSDVKYRIVAGHSTQQDTDNLLEEEDGKDECTSSFVVPSYPLTDTYVDLVIVAMNGELIQDNVRLSFFLRGR